MSALRAHAERICGRDQRVFGNLGGLSLAKMGKAGAQFRSLRESWAHTTTPAERLIVTIIGGIAEFERERGSAPAPATESAAPGPQAST